MDIGKWLDINGEGIYGTRPWKIFGEEPEGLQQVKRGQFDENYKLSFKDIRFTTKDGNLYAFCLGIPTEDIIIKSLGKNSSFVENQVSSVKMMGVDVKVKWSQENDRLVIKKPSRIPSWQVLGFKIEFKK